MSVQVVTGSLLFEPLPLLGGHPHNARAVEIRSARIGPMG
jgi:hypothetical protein